jgi:enoyl-CoA hydratase
MPVMVDYEVEGRIALITLNRLEARNAVNGEVATEMEAAIDQMEADPEVWVGIIRANTAGQERPVFSAGADLKAINAGQGAALGTPRGGFAGFAYRDRTKPVIVAVDGLATAGGCEIVLAADLVVATTRSSFGLAEVKRNLVAGAGGLFRLPKAIGRNAAMELILTGEPLSAERAHALGLVNRLVAPGEAVEEAKRASDPVAAEQHARVACMPYDMAHVPPGADVPARPLLRDLARPRVPRRVRLRHTQTDRRATHARIAPIRSQAA